MCVYTHIYICIYTHMYISHFLDLQLSNWNRSFNWDNRWHDINPRHRCGVSKGHIPKVDKAEASHHFTSHVAVWELVFLHTRQSEVCAATVGRLACTAAVGRLAGLLEDLDRFIVPACHLAGHCQVIHAECRIRRLFFRWRFSTGAPGPSGSCRPRCQGLHVRASLPFSEPSIHPPCSSAETA